MRCEDVRERIEESRLGLLAEPDRRALDRHVAGCAPCAAAAREAARFEDLLDLARDPRRDDVAVDAVLRGSRRRRRRTLILTVGLAASLLAALWLGLTGRVPVLAPGEETTLRAGQRIAVGRGDVRALEATTLRAREEGDGLAFDEGAAKFEVEPGDERYRVVTPAGTIEVIGTQFEVRVMRNGKLLAGGVVVVVAVAAGIVAFRNDHGMERATENELIVATPDGAPRTLNARTAALLLEELADQKKRIDGLESDLKEARTELTALRAAKARPSTDDASSTKPSSPGFDVPASLADTDWKKLGGAIAKLLAPTDDESKFEATMNRMYLMAAMRKISVELGTKTVDDAFYHPRVMGPVLDGTLRALIPTLTDDERQATVRDIVDVATRRGLSPEERAAALPIEKHATDREVAVEVITRARGRLGDGEATKLTMLLTAGGLGGTSSMVSSSPSSDGFAKQFADFVTGRLGIESESEKALALEAGRLFVDRQLAAQERLRAEFGRDVFARTFGIGGERPETPTLDERLVALTVEARLARAQAAAERALYEGASPETRKRMLAADLATIATIMSPPK